MHPGEISSSAVCATRVMILNDADSPRLCDDAIMVLARARPVSAKRTARASAAVALTGASHWWLERMAGWHLNGERWGLAALLAGIVAGADMVVGPRCSDGTDQPT